MPICADSAELHPRAAAIAARFGLQFAGPVQPDLLPSLVLGMSGLEARLPAPRKPRVLRIDFTNPELDRRARLAHAETVVRAVGASSNPPLEVWDATAGFGVDAFLLAIAGARVRAFERNPVIAALLDDAATRAARYPELHALFRERLQFSHQDALQHMKRARHECNANAGPDVVYLDPMFTSRAGAALVRGEMRDLREIVGDDTDDAALLDAALHAAKRRVVVKRMHDAPPIASPRARVHHTLRDGVVRFDVYETGQDRR